MGGIHDYQAIMEGSRQMQSGFEAGQRYRFEQGQRDFTHGQFLQQMAAAETDPDKRNAMLQQAEGLIGHSIPNFHYPTREEGAVAAQPGVAGSERMTPSESVGARGDTSGAQPLAPQAAVPGKMRRYDPAAQATRTTLQELLTAGGFHNEPELKETVATLLKNYGPNAVLPPTVYQTLERQLSQKLQESRLDARLAAQAARDAARQAETDTRQDKRILEQNQLTNFHEWGRQRDALLGELLHAPDRKSALAAIDALNQHIARGKAMAQGADPVTGKPLAKGSPFPEGTVITGAIYDPQHVHPGFVAAAGREAKADLQTQLTEARLSEIRALITLQEARLLKMQTGAAGSTAAGETAGSWHTEITTDAHGKKTMTYVQNGPDGRPIKAIPTSDAERIAGLIQSDPDLAKLVGVGAKSSHGTPNPADLAMTTPAIQQELTTLRKQLGTAGVLGGNTQHITNRIAILESVLTQRASGVQGPAGNAPAAGGGAPTPQGAPGNAPALPDTYKLHPGDYRGQRITSPDGKWYWDSDGKNWSQPHATGK